MFEADPGKALDKVDAKRYYAAADHQKPSQYSERELLEVELAQNATAQLNNHQLSGEWFQFTASTEFSWAPKVGIGQLLLQSVVSLTPNRAPEPAAISSGVLPLPLEYISQVADRLNDAIGGENFMGRPYEDKSLLVAVVLPTQHTRFMQGMRESDGGVTAIFEEVRQKIEESGRNVSAEVN